MSTPREIRRKIASTHNTQKITSAMEMVSSVKLRKARQHMLNARPYANKIAEISAHLSNSASNTSSVLLTPRPVTTVGLVVVSSDKGMCGGFNANIFKKVSQYIRENTDKKVILTLVGKKATDFFKTKDVTIHKQYTNVFFKPNYSDAAAIGKELLNDFKSGTVDEVCIIFNEFKSTVAQKTRVDVLLPVPPLPSETEPQQQQTPASYMLEPDDKSCLDMLLEKYFLFQIWRAFLESYASEQGARMAAMSGATKNAGELISKYTLFYNKARQSAITTELLEVVSGAESLR
jgi:F-type H+-transporting ATPase subunit gamma